MSAPHDPLDELAIPDGTTVEEHDVVTDGDVLIGSNSRIDFGVRGRTIAAGERVHFGRQIEADGDCRLDIWCRTEGSVLAGEDAYIGERTHIGGKLLVSGDLDIGDDVEIEDGFDANGWIVTRNPVPVLVFYFIVISQFLRLGESDKANEFASALAGNDIEERAPLVIPRGSELSDDAWRVSTPARIGDDCRLHGNIRAESITVGRRNTIFGSLRARGDIDVGTGTVIIGDVTTRSGTVTLHAGSHVRGDVSCHDLIVYDGADVDGTLRARGEMKLIQQSDTAPADPEPSARGGNVDNRSTGDNDSSADNSSPADDGLSADDNAAVAGTDAHVRSDAVADAATSESRDSDETTESTEATDATEATDVTEDAEIIDAAETTAATEATEVTESTDTTTTETVSSDSVDQADSVDRTDAIILDAESEADTDSSTATDS